MDFIYDKLTVFLEVPESLNFRVSLHLWFTHCAAKWQIVWLVRKNQDTVAVQNM
jgi:hypothetical protein